MIDRQDWQPVQDEDWKKFEQFARTFYGRCLRLAVEVAGAENPNTSQILLEKLSPDLLTLYEYWKSLER